MKWTEQQTEAITAEGSDILVSAAAGSGKTAVLTERIKRLVTEKQISLENMLVVTFTNAAASEMKEKILNALRNEEERLAALPADDPERKERKTFLRRQIRNASSAEICTFHRFSMNVIRRYFFLTDIDPHFTICDETYGNLLREQCLDDLFEDRFESGDPEFLDFLDHYSDLKGEDRVRKMILQVYDFIMNMAEPFRWLHTQVEALNCGAEELTAGLPYQTLRRGVKKDIHRALAMAETLTAQASVIPELNNNADGKSTIYQKIDANCQIIRDLTHDFDELGDAELHDRITGISWIRLTPRKHEKEAFQEVKDLFSVQNKACKEILKKAAARLPRTDPEETAAQLRATWPYAKTLEQLVIDFSERFTAVKRKKNMLDFSDVEHEAYRILNHPEHPEAAQEYRQRFHAVFIDEYQDSSRIQEAIIRSVSRGDNVYMVGDVKQSIYKFRQADPDLFIEKYNGFEEGTLPGRRIDLSRNFRSKGGIIDAVNGVFREIMTRELSGIAYDKAAELVQGSSCPRGDALDYGVSLHLMDSETVKEDDDTTTGSSAIDEEIAQLSRAQLEGEMIAGLAKSRVGQPIYDDKTGQQRSAGYGDIVILARSGTNMTVYARALAEKGLPTFISGGDGFYETPEIELFLNLLKVIDNHRQDRELISVLFSSIEGFRFTVNELADIRLGHRTGSFYEAFTACAALYKTESPEEEATALARKCARAAELLQEWRLLSGCMPLDDYVWQLMINTGYYNYVSALPGGRGRAANLRLLVEKAAEYVRSYQGSLFRFLRFQDQIKAQGTRMPQAADTGDAANMIRIMTIHKSKGLEFPIVIVPDIAANIRHDADNTDLQLHKNLGIALKYKDLQNHTEARTLTCQSILQTKKEEDLEEEKRILYVAMTRAKDELILTAAKKGLARQLEQAGKMYGNGTQSPDQRLYWVWLNAEAAGIPVHLYSREEFSETVKNEETSIFHLKEAIENGFPSFSDPKGLAGIIQQRFDYLYPFRKDSAAKSKYSVTELNRVMLGGAFDPAQHAQASAADQETPEETTTEEKYREEVTWYEALSDEQEPVFPDICPNPAAGSSQASSTISSSAKDPVNRYSEAIQPKFLSDQKQITPAARGTLTHKVLELIDYSETHTEQTVRAFCETMVSQGLFTEAEAAVLPIKEIAGFFQSEPGRRACRAAKRKNEWAFTLRKKTAELAAAAIDTDTGQRMKELLPDEILVQGIIDCCFRDDKGIVIIDFKTDRVYPSDRRNHYQRFRDHYKRQLSFYCEAIEKEYGEPVADRYLYLLDDGSAIQLSD